MRATECFTCKRPITADMHVRGNSHRDCDLAAFMLDHPRLRPDEAVKLYRNGAVKESHGGNRNRNRTPDGIPTASDVTITRADGTVTIERADTKKAARTITNGRRGTRTWNESRGSHGGGTDKG